MTLLKSINDNTINEDAEVEGYLHQAFLLDENREMIQESFESFLKVAYSVINDTEKEKSETNMENKDLAIENVAKVIVGLLQWKSSGVRGKDPVLYRDIQKKLSSTYAKDALTLGMADKNKKLLATIKQNIEDDKETILRILSDLKNYYSKNGILKKSHVALDISNN